MKQLTVLLYYNIGKPIRPSDSDRRNYGFRFSLAKLVSCVCFRGRKPMWMDGLKYVRTSEYVNVSADTLIAHHMDGLVASG
jgi:hypothetical protein